MMWFKQVSINRGVELYQVDFPQVEGLQVGDRIQVRGIRAGQVDGYEIIGEIVRVAMLLDDKIRLGEDAVVTMASRSSIATCRNDN